MDNVEKLIVAMVWVAGALLFAIGALELGGCTEPEGSAGFAFSEIVQDISVVDVPVETGPDPACIKYDYYFCPPLNQIWQAVVETDICQDPPVVLSISECFQVWECDPSMPNLGEESCITEEGYPGTSGIYCDKGEIVSGPCESECYEEVCDYQDNDCDGETDEGQANACGLCGPLPAEICDGLDNNCNDTVDEGLIVPCATVCDTGYEICTDGQWSSCTAQGPSEEICNMIDDDCDGAIDEGLACDCPTFMIDALVPCAEKPMVCGEGYKTCVCKNPDCSKTEMTACQALCVYLEEDPCIPDIGIDSKELCNNHDDDCDADTDEDLYLDCYTGPISTLDVGICKAGQLTCEKGTWGGYIDSQFFPNLCEGEVVPADEEICNGTDDDCDGETDHGEPLDPTDLLFVIDWSGSMDQEIDAVIQAITLFSANYYDEDVLQWGLAIGPSPVPNSCFGITCPNILNVCYEGACIDCGDFSTMLDACNAFAPDTPCYNAICLVLTGQLLSNQTEFLYRVLDLASFSFFLSVLQETKATAPLAGGREMLLDALYLAAANLSPDTPTLPGLLSWQHGVDSDPPLGELEISWREDTNRVVIVFTDEVAQSYLDPKISPDVVINMMATSPDFKLYAFAAPAAMTSTWEGTGWSGLATSTGGEAYSLSFSALEIYANLLTILEDNACQ